MRWSDIPRHPRPRTLREFAVCLVVLGGLAALWSGGGVWLIVGIVAAILGLVGVTRPSVLRPLFVGWMMAIFPVAWLVSTVVLMLIYFGIFTPMALTFRLFGRDTLGRRFEPDRQSYWEDRPQPESVERYFRQY